MSTEQPPSIICDICKGWHTTEAHAQFEKETREKRIAEIKTRPDSAYRFDTLGCTPEQKSEIEPWMHEVIEKAKELGDDLQDSDFFIHTGPTESTDNTPSVLSFLDQKSFQETGHANRFRPETTYVSPHNAGEELKTFWIDEDEVGDIKSLLDIQERFVKTRTEDDLIAYKQAIQDRLNKIIEKITLFSRSTNNPHYEKYKKEAMDLMQELDTTEGRKKAVKLILRGHTYYYQESVGVIFKLGEVLRKKFECKSWRSGVDCSSIAETGAQERIVRILNGLGKDSSIAANKVNNLESARSFYRMFIHGLYLPHGSVEEQRKLLAVMLEMTKDSPERRLPIYNFYGKLVWPRPPEENKQGVGGAQFTL